MFILYAADAHHVHPTQILQSEKTEGEAAYRALVALGDIVSSASPSSAVPRTPLTVVLCHGMRRDAHTQAFASKEQSRPLTAEQQAAARQVLSTLPSTFQEARIRDVSKEVSALL